MLSVALSLRAQEKGKQIIDGVLLFAPPLIGFGMQYAITRHMAYGPALSALGCGGFYLVLAKFALRVPLLWGDLWYCPPWRSVVRLPLLLSVGAFSPLDGDGLVAGGLGILWLGVQQQQRRMSYSGTALLVLAVGSALWALANGTTALSVMLIFAVLSLSWLVAAWLWRNIWMPGSWALLAGGFGFLDCCARCGIATRSGNRSGGYCLACWH